MIGETFKLLVLSDIHLGNSLNPTAHMVRSLLIMLEHQCRVAELDMLAITGDCFDQVINLASPDSLEASTFIQYLVEQCNRYNVRLRILEGTPSHDNKQSRHFVKYNNSLPIESQCDLKYVDTLSVVSEPDLGLDFLYVPDRCRADSDQVYDGVVDAMEAAGVTKVDYAFMHGCFEYQLPPAAQKSNETHDSKRYKRLVRRNIFIGHHHHPRKDGCIIVPGSTDRIVHGEEHRKGCMRHLAYRDAPSADEFEFIENLQSMIFKTVDLTGQALEDATRTFEVAAAPLGNLPMAHVRVLTDPDPLIIGHVKSLMNDPRYNNLIFKREGPSASKKAAKDIDLGESINLPSPSPETLPGILKAKIKTLTDDTARQERTYATAARILNL